ncbi:MAG: type III-A CRISPR-associated RAMP protein Csm3 [Anaerolineae bacterium]|uniref:type III-A CRISPR-associated RAMP protein Csm3 n=1 Tax=Thermoflexus sp. TaxID=1969742 RepID=UPI0025D3CEA4|nr:type III-A CRISPR-associated RAMP protein Csm3 [Thermoflexus sp.]MCS7351986.1 type III-A CRISPR-associated RAMP protein Csm3 [Thermoflexus sp.]MDW8181445.1 type III-A CRISPR-associated RAMP protein Csm3 [Anaerolineae bacterium]
MAERFQLRGRLFLRAEIHVVTGLHIGGAGGKVAIGGVDNPVIRDPLTDEPILPGSSLKGKMRSLLERWRGFEPNHAIGQARIHVCKKPEEYRDCSVCHVFGVPGEIEFAYPTRLIVRDAFLDPGLRRRLREADLDLPFTEVKWEAAIDRITSAAVPRQIERVPAGAVFRPFSLRSAREPADGGDGPAPLMVYSLYFPRDLEWFVEVVDAMGLVEDDYLGGYGSRGSGQVAFRNLQLGYKIPEGETGSYPADIVWLSESPDLVHFRSALPRMLEEIGLRIEWGTPTGNPASSRTRGERWRRSRIP